MGFFATAGNARGDPTVTSLREPSNVVMVSLPPNDTGVFSCLDAVTGQLLYLERINDRFAASPIVAGDLLYFPSETGITYVNSSTIGAETHLPFGGTRRTGNGHREGAAQTALEIFTEWKTVYVDYSGKLQKAQIDNN